MIRMPFVVHRKLNSWSCTEKRTCKTSMRKSPTLAAILENATDGFQFQCSCNRGCATHNEEVGGWWKVQELAIETLEAQTSNPIAQPCTTM